MLESWAICPFLYSLLVYIRYSDPSDAAPARAKSTEPNQYEYFMQYFRQQNSLISNLACIHLLLQSGTAVCIWLWHPGGQNLLSFGSTWQTSRSFDAKFSSSICRKYYFNYCVCVCVCDPCSCLGTYRTNFANTETQQIDSKDSINFQRHHCVRNNQIKIVNDYFKSGVKETPPGLEYGALSSIQAPKREEASRGKANETDWRIEYNIHQIFAQRDEIEIYSISPLNFVINCFWEFWQGDDDGGVPNCRSVDDEDIVESKIWNSLCFARWRDFTGGYHEPLSVADTFRFVQTTHIKII